MNKPKQNSKIVFCVGGSSTYGNVNDDLTYPAQLQKYLNRHSSKFIVYNLGLAGISSRGYLWRILSLSLKLKPDYVVIYSGYNDSEEKHMFNFNAYEKVADKFNKLKFAFLCKYSLIFRQIYVRFAIMKPKVVFGRDLVSEALERKIPYNAKQDIRVRKKYTQAFADTISMVIDYVNSIGGKVIYLPEYCNHQIDSLTYKSRVEEGGLDNILKNEMTAADVANLVFFSNQEAVEKMIRGRNSQRAVYLEPLILKKYPTKAILQDDVHFT